MSKNKVIFYIIICCNLVNSIFASCQVQPANNRCLSNYLRAEKCADNFSVSNDTFSLDTALYLLNKCSNCDSIKSHVVNLKITVLMTLKRYQEGAKYVDSLKKTDFDYNYQKEIVYKNFLALEYNLNKDTINRNLVYSQMAGYLEDTIQKLKDFTSREFEQIFIDLFVVKNNYLDSIKINREIDSLKKIYPQKEHFFDYLKGSH